MDGASRTGPRLVAAALAAVVALTTVGCGSGTTTATAPSTTAPVARSAETTTTEEPPTTETPGAVSGAAALGGATDREEDDASALDADEDATSDDTTYEEGIIAETGADEVAADVTWSLNAADHRGQEGLLVAYECPPDGTFGPVWGTDAYTDDSSVCTAAVHVGLISEVDGGLVVIQISDGLDAYEGSTANGVTTGTYGPWAGTFTFVS